MVLVIMMMIMGSMRRKITIILVTMMFMKKIKKIVMMERIPSITIAMFMTTVQSHCNNKGANDDVDLDLSR